MKRKLGVVYTPESISSHLTEIALNACTAKRLRILEPSVGDGSFLKAIAELSTNKHRVSAVDVDGDIVQSLSNTFKRRFAKTSEFVEANFLDFALDDPKRRYHLVLGNPPFIRKHSFSDEFKVSIERLSFSTQFDRKHLKNAWAAFIVAAETILRDDGVMALVVPYELVNVDYGETLQREIFCKFDRVDIYLPSKRAFEAIEQDAVAFVARKKTTLSNGIYIHGVESLATISDGDRLPKSTINIANSNYVALDSKSFLLASDATSLIGRLKLAIPKLSEYCKTAPGIVTGANDFFILSQVEIEEYGLQRWCQPILKKGSYLFHTPVFSKKALSKLLSEHPSHLLCIDEIALEKLPKYLQKYLSSEAAREFAQRYKCRNRKHWYSVPIVSSTPAFFFKRSYRYPRIVVNQANTLTTDTAYGISPKRGVTAKGICYSFYNSMTLLFAEIEGRFYGGGVLELTPREFQSLPMSYIKPSKDAFSKFQALHTTDGDTAKLVAHAGNEWLSQKLSLSKREIALLEESWIRLRNHRLRHGGNARG